MGSLVFIDARVEDWQRLQRAWAGSADAAEVIPVALGRDGLAQVADALQGRQDVEAIHIVSHGRPGTLVFGVGDVDVATLEASAPRLAAIGACLAENADILLYGCKVAEGPGGDTFIDRLGELTGANVAASTQVVGATEFGGNWRLEVTTGAIRAAVLPRPADYAHTLDLIDGTAGDDSLAGTLGDDTLQGLDGNDTLLGDEGRDYLRGGAGVDSLDGGVGADVAFFEDGTEGLVIDLLTGVVGNDGYGNAETIAGVEAVHGTEYADHITLGDGGGYTFSLAGNDTLIGGTGNDEFIAGSGDDSVDGGAGIDTLSYPADVVEAGGAPTQGIVADLGAGIVTDLWGDTDTVANIENVSGSSLDDSIAGNAGANSLYGNDGNDTLSGGAGADNLYGGSGNDSIDGGSAADNFFGDAGDDTFVGGGHGLNEYDFAIYLGSAAGVIVDLAGGTAQTDAWGTDTLVAIDGVIGSSHSDTIVGAATDNYLRGRGGSDSIDGGAGFDIADYRDSGAVVASLVSGSATYADNTVAGVLLPAGTDTLAGMEGLSGSHFDDTLLGSGGDNYLRGQRGNDLIDGGAGIDRAAFNQATGAVTVNLETGTASGADGDDTLIGIENIRGSAHGDTLVGDANANHVEAREGNDTAVGGAGNDTLVGEAGDDSLQGDDGEDFFVGGLGDDTLVGGAQTANLLDAAGLPGRQFFDIADYSAAAGPVVVDLAAGTATGADGNDVLVGIEATRGSAYNDTLTGDANDNLFRGNGGDDSIDGGDGYDVLDYGNAGGAVGVDLAAGTATGAAGNDVFSGIEVAIGGAHDDTLNGDAGDNAIRGNAGNDSLDGGDGIDRVDYRTATGSVVVDLAAGLASGADGSDTLAGFENLRGSDLHADTLTGDGGGNAIEGRGGSDVIDGAAGDDTLVGDDGDDTLYGGGGDDVIDGGTGTDWIVDGAGSDTIDGGSQGDGVADTVTYRYSALGTGISVTMTGAGAGSVVLGGDTDVYSGIEAIEGSEYADQFAGSEAADMFSGAEGNDSVTGNGGGDFLNGQAGEDAIDAGAGNDAVLGGDGADTLLGGEGMDTLVGGEGNDSIDGGAITDLINYTDLNLVDYTSASSAIVLNLETGVVQDGLGGTDTLANVNFVVGSAGNDTLTGSTAVRFEQFTGGAGNDVIDGGAVTDTLKQLNVNRVNYSNTDASVTVDLAAGTATGTTIGSDTLINIQHANGSSANDTLYGSNSTVFTEQFRGHAGDDFIDGRGGTDVARYDNTNNAVDVNLAAGAAQDGLGGTDTLVSIEGARGGGGNDTLAGGNAASDAFEFFIGMAGNDAIDGGSGYDRVDYTPSTAGVVVTLGGAGNGSASDGYGTTDTLVAIEGVRGSSFNDLLAGSAVATLETFEGREGNDTIDGVSGLDRVVYQFSRAGVTVDLATGTAVDGEGGTDTLSNIDEVQGTRDFDDAITGNSGANRLEGLGGADTLGGGSGADTLDGGAGDDTLDGGVGNDSLVGGSGNDTYIVGSTLDVISETSTQAAQIDLVQSTVSWALGANLEDLTLGGTSSIDGTGNELANAITGNGEANLLSGLAGDDTIRGGAGNDTLDGDGGTDSLLGGDGNDTYVVDGGETINEQGTAASTADLVQSSVAWTLNANLEQLTLTGSAAIAGAGNSLANLVTGNGAANLLEGASGADTLQGGNGNDTLDGGVGSDSLVGGSGNDTYVVGSTSDVVSETSTQATQIDLVNSAVDWTLGANLENLSLTGSAAIDGTGNELANTLTGNAAANALSGGSGSDTLVGGGGADTLIGGSGDDVLDGGADSDDFVLANGDRGSSIINDAGGAADALSTTDEGFGVYTEFYRSGTSLVIENYDELTNGALLSTVTVQGFTGTGYIEQWRSTDASTGAVAVYSLANSATGTAAVDLVLGTKGADTLSAAAGDDVLFASAGNDSLDGGTGSDALRGGQGNDTLNGGAGIDQMLGQSGNDVYFVDDVDDIVDERVSYGPNASADAGGNDTVNASSGAAGGTFALAAFVETLVLQGVTAINGTGNTLANVIIGNGAANLLDGGTGDDTLSGGAGNDTLDGDGGNDSLVGGTGNDTYIVDSAADTVSETSTLASEIDTVRSAVTLTLGANLEKLTLTGSNVINGTGNTLANTITGNGAANTLNGGTGADTLIGGLGSDTYVVDDALDVVTESSTLAAEIDTVRSGVTRTLGANLENLTLTGSSAIDGTGNGLANTLIGNTGANVLKGSGGDDTLDGGRGNDSLTGGAGVDVFRFSSTLNGTTNVDRLGDFSAADDRILLDDAVFTGIGPLGRIASANFRLGTAAGDASDRVIYNSATGQLFFDGDGNGAGAAVLFATVAAGTTITFDDIWIG